MCWRLTHHLIANTITRDCSTDCSEVGAEAKVGAMSERLEIVQADITRLTVDAIVNAANSSLLGGGGVDGAIHRAAGPGLLEECRRLGGCRTGEAKLSKGHNLPARFVIHTVGPVWGEGVRGEEELLASCYRSSLTLAQQHGIKTIAFPAISTGIYGFPMERAARIAVREVRRFLQRDATLEKVILVCYDRRAYDIFAAAAKETAEQACSKAQESGETAH